ncbi:septal ring lytic transglycosylase RlpA family protein [Flavobacterium rakeshii]|uniref:Probable endolytic peptidoglycan transglycosylase RlpA n=1 Tax=Flavobacterium rakeshii TaxID=1038845 RepID=A0A6N8HIB2_9FLAO|nr:septal ring lytic transglycosylase RlpA family protein [Flavobacterium rakeshii]MUV05504.1 septal ring lytic transglycosylase RlpA family protein [Flavobacterium rakeshii]
MKKVLPLTFLLLVVFVLSSFSAHTVFGGHSTAFVVNRVSDTVSQNLTVYKTDVVATYYHDKFNGRKTSSGERFDNAKYTAAHKSLPFGTQVRVTNLTNGKYVDVTVNDRGPFSKKLEIDLTKKAFMEITGNKNYGTLKVKIEIIE